MELLQSIKSGCFNTILSLSIWNDIILLIYGAILPPIVTNSYQNIQRIVSNSNRRNRYIKPLIGWLCLFFLLSSSLVGYIYVEQNYTIIPDIIGTDHEYAERQLSAAGLKYSAFYGRDGDVVLSINGDKFAKKGSNIELVYGRKTIKSDNVVDGDMDSLVSMPDMYLITEINAYENLTTRGF